MMGQYGSSLPLISTLSQEGGYEALTTSIQPTIASLAVTTVANEARFFPLRLAAPFLLTKLWWMNGTAVSGNVDVGIYTANGARLASTGSTAQSGTTAVQSAALGTPILLMSDMYYIAWCADNTTATMATVNLTNGLPDARRYGMYTQTSAFVLPATATFAQTTSGRLCVVGISSRSTI